MMLRRLSGRAMGRGMSLVALGMSVMLSGCAGGGRLVAPATTAAACVDVSFPIYFAESADQLTDPARQALDVAAAQVRGCHINYVSVIGLSDSVGSASDNLQLSQRRALTVAAALKTAGLPAPKFEVRALGEAGAIAQDGKPVPLRRRTDVVIHATPRRS